MLKSVKNWFALIRERFNPAQYIPMIFVFTLANASYLSKAENLHWDNGRLLIVFLMIFSFFFRMRLFDEIKDYEVDLKINPTRPLARGILSISQVKKALLILIAFELIVAGCLGWGPFLVHAAAIGYSLLMYEEFFVGDLLRPHLTTYAITHTFVSVLLGISAAVSLTGFDVRGLHPYHLAFFLMNWAIFNLFEFARKTFAASEEKPNSPSYSSLFGHQKAYLLSITEALIAVLLLGTACRNPLMQGYSNPLFWSAFAVYSFSTSAYFFNPSVGNAKIFRAFTGVYLLLNYVLIVYTFGV